MAINIATETILTIHQAVKFAPRAAGKPVSWKTFARWCRDGHRGVVLESLTTPSGRITSIEAIERFYQKLSALAGQPVRTERDELRHERALASLEAMGVKLVGNVRNKSARQSERNR